MATETTQIGSQPAGVDETTVGLVANGSAGAWDVAVDESLAGPEQWFLQMEGPSFYLYFSIQSPQAVEGILAFLDKHLTTSHKTDRHLPAVSDAEIEAGCFDGGTVRFLWDEEDSGRLTILISGGGDCTSRSTVSGGDVRDFTEALRQMRDELREAGLLAHAS